MYDGSADKHIGAAFYDPCGDIPPEDYLKTITEELISRNGFLKEIRRIAEEDDGK